MHFGGYAGSLTIASIYPILLSVINDITQKDGGGMIIDVSEYNVDVSEYNGQIDIVIRDPRGGGIIIDVSEHNGKIDAVIRDIAPRGASLPN